MAKDADVLISGLTIKNGVSPQGGGVYNSEDATLTLSHVTVEGNVALNSTIEDSEIDPDNVYTGSFGGGIYCSSMRNAPGGGQAG